MRFFTFIASLFESDKPTSASRFFAFMAILVLCGGVIYFYSWCKIPEDVMSVFKYLMVFILVLIGFIKAGDLLTLRTGIRVSETKEVTPTTTTTTVDKTVSQVQKDADPPITP